MTEVVSLPPNGRPALVLNADFRPLSYYPLSLWPWQEVVKAVFLDRVEIVYHQAGQPGVRKSWGIDFASYIDANVSATQRGLEALCALKMRRQGRNHFFSKLTVGGTAICASFCTAKFSFGL